MATAFEGPGAVRVAEGTIVLNADRTREERLTLVILNTGDRPVQIGSTCTFPTPTARWTSTGRPPRASASMCHRAPHNALNPEPLGRSRPSR